MTTFKQVRDGIIDILKLLKTSNGYGFDLPDDKIFKSYRNPTASDEFAYPRAVVILEREVEQKEIASRVKLESYFIISVALKRSESETALQLQDQLESVAEDFLRLFRSQSDLNGLVETLETMEWSTDAGAADPEAIAVFLVKTVRN